MSVRSGDSSGAVWVARGPGCVYFRVERLGDMNNAMAFRDFFEEMLGRGCRRFVLDLKSCAGLDSTFIGTLMALQYHVRNTDGAEFIVVNMPESCRESLGLIGALPYLVVGGPMDAPPFDLVKLESRPMLAKERAEMILAAHEALVRVDAANEKRFGEFLRVLGEELRRAEGGSETSKEKP